MNILLISERLGCSGCINLNRRAVVGLMVGIFLALPLLAGYGGYRWAVGKGLAGSGLASKVEADMAQQRLEVAEAKRVAEENLTALTLRLGQMQAHVMRLDALGQRLTKLAKLDKGEFDFTNPPPQGGPESGEGSAIQLNDFMTQLDALSLQLDNRSQQLSVLETMMVNKSAQSETMPSGRAASSGWLSSGFGMRNDPFTGRLTFHKGIDLAGKEGSQVKAVGAGVVTWSGNRFGYGYMVEVTHGNGFVTRYGHNSKLLVKVGDTVRKGQSIALLGNSGHSTGPHLHLEVYRDGVAVDPARYIDTSS